jgi:PKD repeat protein
VTSYNHVPYISDIVVDEIIILPVTAYFSASAQRVLPGETVAFTDTSAGTRVSWAWSFPGGTPETSTEQNPVITYSGRGVFDVSLIVGNGLSFDTLVKTEYITCDFAIGQEQKEESGRLSITPNPSSGLFTISMQSGTSATAAAEITNLAGTTVFTATLHRQDQHFTETIDLRSIAKGIYILKVNTDETRIVQKIIIR